MPEQRTVYTSQGGSIYSKLVQIDGGLNTITWTKNTRELEKAAYVSKKRALELRESYKNFNTMRRDRGQAFLDQTLTAEDRDGHSKRGGIMVYLEGGKLKIGGPIVSRDPPFQNH